MYTIKENKVRCSKCGDVITSVVESVFKSCTCGYIKIAGGQFDKIRVKADGTPALIVEDFTELSTYVFSD